MNANFLAIIKKIVSKQGEAILADPQRLKGWISDYAKDEPKAERLAFGRCIEYGAYRELKNAPAQNRTAVKNHLAQKLHSDEGLDTAICAGALDLLEAALFGVPEQKTVCRNCGKELQKGWKVCPYCGTSFAALAAATARPVEQKTEDQAKSYFKKSYTLFEQADYDGAIASCTEAIKLNPKIIGAYVMRGGCYRMKDDEDRAIADFTNAIKLNPQDAFVYVKRGECYQSKDDYDRAIADFTEAIKLNPQDAFVYVKRGECYQSKDDYDQAIADFTKTIKLDPENARAYAWRGLNYLSKDNYGRAIADSKMALSIDPDDDVAKEVLKLAR